VSALAEARLQLVSSEPIEEPTLTRLASVWIAGRPEFAADLRRLLAANGFEKPLSPLTEDQLRERLQRAAEHERAVAEATERVAELGLIVTDGYRAVEVDGSAELEPIERATEAAENAALCAGKALERVRDALAGGEDR
jgi:hypothetical protein